MWALWTLQSSVASHRKYSMKKSRSLKFRNIHRKTPATPVFKYFFWWSCKLKRDSSTGVFCEYCKIFRNIYFKKSICGRHVSWNHEIRKKLRKFIEIGKSLISYASPKFEWTPKCLVTRLLSQNFRFNISKYLLRC